MEGTGALPELEDLPTPGEVPESGTSAASGVDSEWGVQRSIDCYTHMAPERCGSSMPTHGNPCQPRVRRRLYKARRYVVTPPGVSVPARVTLGLRHTARAVRGDGRAGEQRCVCARVHQGHSQDGLQCGAALHREEGLGLLSRVWMCWRVKNLFRLFRLFLRGSEAGSRVRSPGASPLVMASSPSLFSSLGSVGKSLRQQVTEKAASVGEKAARLSEGALTAAEGLKDKAKEGLHSSSTAATLASGAAGALAQGRGAIGQAVGAVGTSITDGALGQAVGAMVDENEQVDSLLRAKNARILELEAERTKMQVALKKAMSGEAIAEALAKVKRREDEMEVMKERVANKFKELTTDKVRLEEEKAALQEQLSRVRASSDSSGGWSELEPSNSPLAAFDSPAADATAAAWGTPMTRAASSPLLEGCASEGTSPSARQLAAQQQARLAEAAEEIRRAREALGQRDGRERPTPRPRPASPRPRPATPRPRDRDPDPPPPPDLCPRDHPDRSPQSWPSSGSKAATWACASRQRMRTCTAG